METLHLRQLQPEDTEDFYQLNLDVEELKYTSDEPLANIATARIFLMNHDQYQKYGVGRMALIRKEILIL